MSAIDSLWNKKVVSLLSSETADMTPKSQTAVPVLWPTDDCMSLLTQWPPRRRCASFQVLTLRCLAIYHLLICHRTLLSCCEAQMRRSKRIWTWYYYYYYYFYYYFLIIIIIIIIITQWKHTSSSSSVCCTGSIMTSRGWIISDSIARTWILARY